MQKLIDGKKISKDIKDSLREEIRELTKKYKRAPCLAVLLVGDDPASHVYVAHKKKACEAVGILSKGLFLPKESTKKEVLRAIKELNERLSGCNEVLIPLINKETKENIEEALESAKSVLKKNLGETYYDIIEKKGNEVYANIIKNRTQGGKRRVVFIF